MWTDPAAVALRAVVHGEDRALSFAQLARLREAAPEAEVVAVYGSTEAEPVSYLDATEIGPGELAAMCTGKGLPAGIPVPAVRLRIIADRWGTPLGEFTAEEFSAATCPPDESGEIVVTGDHVLKSYLHGHGEGEIKFRVEGETWHRTGDAGRLDHEGRLWLLGRCAAKVGDARGVQYPLAVECAARLLRTGGERCAFVAWRGRRCLFVEISRPLPDEETARLRAALDWSFLDDIHRLAHLPMDRRHHSKIDYVALAKILRR